MLEPRADQLDRARRGERLAGDGIKLGARLGREGCEDPGRPRTQQADARGPVSTLPLSQTAGDDAVFALPVTLVLAREATSRVGVGVEAGRLTQTAKCERGWRFPVSPGLGCSGVCTPLLRYYPVNDARVRMALADSPFRAKCYSPRRSVRPEGHVRGGSTVSTPRRPRRSPKSASPGRGELKTQPSPAHGSERTVQALFTGHLAGPEPRCPRLSDESRGLPPRWWRR